MREGSSAVKILAFSGSTREGSLNQKLVHVAALGAKEAGVEVTIIDLRDLPMPLYDTDLETQSGLPENVKRFKALLKEHHGLLIATPEYNGSYTGVLKNAIDWASRPAEGEAPLECFTGKWAALVSASPGGFGGMRSLAALRLLLGNIGVNLLAEQIAVPQAHEAFDETNQLKTPKQQASVTALGGKLAVLLKQLHT